MLRIGVRLSRRFDDAGEYLADARALDAAGVDSLWLDDAGYEPWLVLSAIATVTGRARLVVPSAASEGISEPVRDARLETLARLSRGRVTLADDLVVVEDSPDVVQGIVASRPTPLELWASIKMPADREEWRRVRADYEAAGACGVIVPCDPRLLDLLRNGDEEDDRSDLGLAQG